MKNKLLHRLETIREVQLHQSLTHMKRGLEKESLRVNSNGELAQTRHPAALGSALTHQWITTDYSEALLEFITPVFQDIKRPLAFLHDLHRFTYQNLDQELLWVNSMPCLMGDELSIPIADYGSSNVGKMKHYYRHGLWHRYGRYMQTIAGIHYNVSIPDTFWSVYHQLENSGEELQDFISGQYFGLIRNFLRNVGLVVYLYGASPAVCGSFLRGREHQLETFQQHTCYMPYGTSLRMSDLGYHNDAQAGLKVSYNSLDEYVSSLQHAIRTPYPPYEKLGVKNHGQYQQLNTNILQIENEFYSSIRPKRVTQSGERPTCALADRGVEYIELRCVDLDPFSPLGITDSQIRFLDVFALYCLLEDSPALTEQEQQCNIENLQSIVTQGRDPQLRLTSKCTQAPFRQWAQEHLQKMLQVAQLFDQAHGHSAHSGVVKAQMQKLAQPELTPSAQVMTTLFEQQQPFFEFAMNRAQDTANYFKNQPLSSAEAAAFTKEARRSIEAQRRIEAEDDITFEQYLDNFFAQDACN
ncbi:MULTISPECIES: glutamate--cysteine ligase [unclassified Ketobacter]|uniref:glutamate--cysteine ligase n=1 Tax=unclassified Ketobacter TaxID=2639109 RepID=UPI0025C2BD16|nr:MULTISPECIES: glutamate--cysteine ligase [unclassified Ketobacter]